MAGWKDSCLSQSLASGSGLSCLPSLAGWKELRVDRKRLAQLAFSVARMQREQDEAKEKLDV
uniref:Uncharacterized protein n=1 Tax=Picea glauca TaxID=3330 RepID=A0A101M022_PICGL|nr:hypothetical protein ABT39_MTgene5358 [Picea glauca]